LVAVSRTGGPQPGGQYLDPNAVCPPAFRSPCCFQMPPVPSAVPRQPATCSSKRTSSSEPDRPSPFESLSPRELGIDAAVVAERVGETSSDGGEGGAQCCPRERPPPPKRAKYAVVDSHADLEAAIASGAPVINCKQHVRDADRMVCQVAGCGRSLVSLKDYHQRYRVCEAHIRLPAIVKDGRLQRFCQQCGRFHPLVAFDGARKSCREQLDKHNARRRRRAQTEAVRVKPQPDACDAVGPVGDARHAEDHAELHAKHPAAVEGDDSHEHPLSAAGGGAPFCDGTPELGWLLAELMKSPEQLRSLRLLLGVPTNAALPALQPFQPFDCPVCDPDRACSGSGPSCASEPASYALARDISEGRGGFAAEYTSEHRGLRISMKLFNRTPADLPPDLRQQVTSWLAEVPPLLEGYIRPGCVHLTLHALVGRHAYDAAAKAGVQDLVRHLLYETRCPFWWSGSYAVQLLGRVAMVTDGRVECSDCGLEADAAQHAARGVPRPDQLCVVGRGASGTPITLSCEGCTDGAAKGGAHACGIDVHVHCAFRGRQARAQLCCDGRGGGACAAVVPHLDGCGVATVECSRGMHWHARPLLVVDSDELAAEVQQLAACVAEPLAGEDARRPRWHLDEAQVDTVLVDLGLVLSHLNGFGAAAAALPVDALCLKACRLLALACDMGWCAVAQRILPLAMRTYGSASGAVDAVDAAAPRGGLSLLHRAARSGSLPLLHRMLHWGAAHSYAWRADRAGPGGLTPLHLAALHDDVRIAVLLLDHCPPSAYTRLLAADGVTPFHLAFQMGHHDLTSLLHALRCSLRSSCQPARSNPVVPGIKSEEEPHRLGGLPPDECEHCHSSLPPLMLNVEAACLDCSKPRPCILGGGEDACGEMCYGGRCLRMPSPCAHAHGNVYHVTAMCQDCHINRSLVAA